MDTLFRLVSLQSSDQQQQSSFNSSRTSTTSSRSTKSHYHYQYQQQQQQQVYFLQKPYNSSSQEEEEGEECNNHYHYMDEDFSSSSSSKHFLPNNPTPTPPSSALDFSFPRGINQLNLSGGAGWASNLLTECARSVATRDTQQTQQLMWAINELSSPYGDNEQKVAAYFLQGLFARLTSSGPRTLRTLSSACDRTASFDSTRRVALRFQELSPWSTFGHVAANGAILESFLEGSNPPMRLHILDLSNTFCTQWPTLLEALATRSADDTPHLSITTVVSSPSSSSSSAHRVMKEIAARMEKFARLMGVPFTFNTVHHGNDLSTLDLDQLNIQFSDDTALAVNCVNALHGVSPSNSRRDSILASLRRLNPRIVTIVEEEADLEVIDDDEEEETTFLKGFRESLRFFSAYFDSLEESFPRTSNERLALERSAGRAVVDLVACPASESAERRGTGCGWSARMRAAGFSPAPFSDDVTDDIRALLRRYREGWSMEAADPASGAAGVFLTWKERSVVWASAWKLL